MQIYIDGKYYPEDEAKVSVFDHGLLYGDGVFEGIRFYNGRVFRLEEHVRRLFVSAKAILLDVGISEAEMCEVVVDTVRENGLRDGYIRLLVTRGVGSLGLSPFLCEKAAVIAIADKIALYAEERYDVGLKLVTCATRRPTPAALSPSVKSLNYLNNVLAKVEAIHGGGDEGLMLNEQGYIAECTGDNVFVVRDGKVRTPPSSAGALPGITRDVMFEIADEFGIELREAVLTCYDLYAADECFLTGTAAEVIAAVELDKRPIGDGKPGPLTRRFIERFREIVGSEGTPID